MRILQVVHDFGPRHVGGAELYCYYLSSALAAREHDIHVLFTEFDWSRPQYSYRRFSRNGLTCHEVVNNHEYRSFDRHYVNSDMDDRFERVLDEAEPDVVHLQHLANHSLNYPRLARRRGVPVIFTLHDYWLSCLNHGQRLHADRGVCADIDIRSCADCVSRFPPVPPLATVLRRWTSTAGRARGATAAAVAESTDQAALERVKSIYRRLIKRLTPATSRMVKAAQRLEAARAAARHVNLFLAPSKFLADRMIEFGLPADRVLHSPNGMRTDLLWIQRRHVRLPVRFGFVGSVAPHKGVHLLLDAFIRAAGGTTMRPMELRIHGNLAEFPSYVARLRALAADRAVSFPGEFDNERASDIYADLDALVIPSIWWENAPLVLFEARLTGTPVIAADGGSLPDLVERSDALFRHGDPDDLARCLTSFADRPRRATASAAPAWPVKSIVQDAYDMEQRYAALIAESLPSRRARGADRRR